MQFRRSQIPLIAAIGLAGATNAYAEEFVVEEVVVTANKRGAQNLQDIAGSIQAIGADTLEKLGAEGFEDYIKQVPGLTSVSSGTGQSQIVIRGVNAQRIDHQSVQSKSLAGIYLNDMPISLAGFNPDLNLLDVERVEVLRGPQGTLYGASSMSGTIRIITKAPSTEEFSGKINTSIYNTKDGDISYGINGSANIPISDSLAARVGVYTNKRGGFIDNVAPDLEEDDYNDEDVWGFRGVLQYQGDDLTVTGTAWYQEMESDGRPDEYLPDPTDPRVAGVTGELQTVKFIDDVFENDFLGLNLVIDYDTEHFNIVSATSYFDSETVNLLDDTYRLRANLPLDGPGAFPNPTDYDGFIEEIRLSTTHDEPWNIVVGLYYEDSTRQLGPRFAFAPGLDAFATMTGAFPTSQQLGTSLPDTLLEGTETVDSTQLALFGELSYAFTETLELTLGFRWFDYENDFTQVQSGLIAGGPSRNEDSIEEDDWIPKVQLTYQPSDDVTLYVTYSEGFRTGGVNDSVPTECDAELAALGLPRNAPFVSDELQNMEFGAKTSWLDNRFTANISVYRIKWSDIQTGINFQCDFFQTLNAGTLENTGIEGEFSLHATENLSLRFGFAYVDAEVDKAAPLVNSEGDEPPYVPELTATGSVEYRFPISSGSAFVRGDVRYVDSMVNEFSSRAGVMELDSYSIVDFTAGYERGSWQFSLFARNLFDDEVITNIDPDRAQPAQFTRGRPRTLGVSATKHF